MIDGLPWAKKIVDDILVWAPSLPELKTRVETIAENCKRMNITLSKRKFEVGRQIQFAGYLVGENGVKPDLKSFLDFIQLSLFFIDPLAQNSRRARAPASRTGRKGPITEYDT